ncbi:hypothetical protein OPV22_018845 [Ensete ventricosum]|uniref:Uncharacterized protein n=1 Tax=Ensete ventricosum TaxID=4639 RepID=A0AAV8R2W3_ENSVE|nr:hypothetical protein OPV22_018845 [Ensete ventricosum]
METFLFAAAGDGYDLAVDAASGSLGAGRERRDPSADEPLPALHQLNRRRKATTFSFFRCSRSRVLHATRPRERDDKGWALLHIGASKGDLQGVWST